MVKEHAKFWALIFALVLLIPGAVWAQTPADAVADAVANSGAFPAGTQILNLVCDGDAIAIDLSAEAVPSGFSDTQSDGYTSALFAAVSAWPEINSISVTVGGIPISAFLPASTLPDFPAVGEGGITTQSVREKGYSVNAAQNPLLSPSVPALSGELAGKLIVLGPSHGSYVYGTPPSVWYRAMRTFSGPNPVTNCPPDRKPQYQPSDYYYYTKGYTWPMYYEDDMSPEMVRFLYAYCQAGGAATYVNRNLDKTAGLFPATQYGYPAPGFTLPKWMTACKYALEDRGGIPSSVWNTSDVTTQSDKDLRARAYYVNWLMQTLGYDYTNTLYLAMHSNAATATQCTPNQAQARGTETFDSKAFTAWTTQQAKSNVLSSNTCAAIVNSIRAQYDGFWANAIYNIPNPPPEWCTGYGTYRGYDHAAPATPSTTAGWQNRGPKSGNYGEIRECKCPATLVELVFHDDWKFYPDQAFHQDQIFRATTAWGMYEGFCTFFGVTPKPRLAASVDSVTFPAFVLPNTAVSGSISMKNLGMAWCWGNKMEGVLYVPYTVWKLEATAADQFGAAGTKVAIDNDGIYYPGDTAAFDVSVTSPATSGYYTTSWRMLKDDARGGSFGATATATIGVDGDAPVVTITSPEAKWYNGDPITVSFSAADAMSGVASIVADVDGAPVNSGDSVPGLATGAHTLTVTATDNVGNVAVASVTFNVDRTPPVITITSPVAGDYLHAGSVAVSFNAVDPDSGVASVSATMDGAPIANGAVYSLLWTTLGPHTLAVTAVDVMGNSATKTVTFNVIATIESMIQAVNEFYACGQIDNEGIQNSLLVKLAKYEKDTGDVVNAKTYLRNFINEVSAQRGKHITEVAADSLLADAAYCIAQLGG